MESADKNQHHRPNLVKLDRLPDFSNEFTKVVLEKSSDFVYDQNEDEELANLPFFGPVEMENNAYYIG